MTENGEAATLRPLMHRHAASGPEPQWAEILELLDTKHRFLITTHVNPDGDGLGAELGLWGYLRAQGKDARIINPDPLPPRYGFLAKKGKFEVYRPEAHDAVIDDTEVVVVLDISRWERLEALGARLREAKAAKVCIDHHPFENNGMADYYAVDMGAAATGQLVYEMIRDRGHEVNESMATGFYISILTDTGSFRFTNSDARAHTAAAELIEKGLDPYELYESVYGNWTLARIRLLGDALSHLRVEEDGKLFLIVLTQEMVTRAGAMSSDTEGFVDIVRSIKGCEGVALLMERKDGSVKTSLRSRGRINVNRVAEALGGGGHILASGATVPGPLDTAAERVLQGLREEVGRLETDA